jgi:hypothetical protein
MNPSSPVTRNFGGSSVVRRVRGWRVVADQAGLDGLEVSEGEVGAAAEPLVPFAPGLDLVFAIST